MFTSLIQLSRCFYRLLIGSDQIKEFNTHPYFTLVQNGWEIPLSVNPTTVKIKPQKIWLHYLYRSMHICLVVWPSPTLLLLLHHCFLSNSFSGFHHGQFLFVFPFQSIEALIFYSFTLKTSAWWLSCAKYCFVTFILS